MTRELAVFVDRRPAGRLVDVAGLWSFEYAPEWRADGFELSPGLPLRAEPFIDGGRIRPVMWFFENLLPEPAARERLAGALGPGEHDGWDLLAAMGSETAGALRLLPVREGRRRPGSDAGPPRADFAPFSRPAHPAQASPAAPEAALRPLTDADLAERIRRLAERPLVLDAPRPGLLPGRHDKLPVVVDADGRLAEPVGDTLSTHLAVPDAPDRLLPASAANAWYCARVAQELGFDVPAVELRFVPDAVLLVERFDRVRDGSSIACRHVIDGAQFLSLPAAAHAERAGAGALREIVARCRAKAATRIALFRRTVLDVLLGHLGGDLKMLSFFGGREGYALAPCHGLVSDVAWIRPELRPGESILADVALPFPIGGATRFAELQRRHLAVFGAELGLPPVTVERELDRLVGRIAAAADRVLAEYDARPDVPRRLRAGQRRLLATIRNMPVAEMSRRLVH